MAERVAVSFGRADEIAVDQVVAKRSDLGRLAQLQGRHPRGPKRATEDAAQLQHAPLFGRKQVESGEDRRLHGVGQAFE